MSTKSSSVHAGYMQGLGRRMHTLRKAMEGHYTQQDIACRAGIRRKTYGLLEHGQGNPCLKTLARIAHALGVDLPTLLAPEGAVVQDAQTALLLREIQTMRQRLDALVRQTQALQGGIPLPWASSCRCPGPCQTILTLDPTSPREE